MSDNRVTKTNGGLFAELKKHPLVMAIVILVHVGVAILLSMNLASDEKPPMPAAQKQKIINAVVVDAKQYDKRKKDKELAAKKKIVDAEQKRKKELERKKRVKKQAEEKKAIEKKRKKEIQIAKKKADEKKLNEIKLKEKKAKEKKAKDKKAEEDKAREKKAKEKKAKEKEAKEKKERELKEKQRLAAEKKRKEEDERKRRAEEKAELKRSLLEEERREEEARKAAVRAARLQTQREQYIMQIGQKVENNWLRPATNIAGHSCDVIVTQTMQGDVIDVQLKSCTDNNAFQRSVERAVRKASPLPLPPNPDVYDRQIYFTFKPR